MKAVRDGRRHAATLTLGHKKNLWDKKDRTALMHAAMSGVVEMRGSLLIMKMV